jgi:type III secretory pathway component EscT
VEFPPSELAFAIALAASVTFAATVPLASESAVPSIVRLTLALAMTPLCAAHPVSEPHSNIELIEQACVAASIGATLGLSASIVAAAAGAAGSLIDHALAGGLSGGQEGGDGTGPFALLLPLGFSYALCSVGALDRLMVGVAMLGSTLAVQMSAGGVVGLARFACETAAALALPPLFANALATMVSGIVARVVPRSSGMLLVPALGSPLALCTVLAGVGSTMVLLRDLALATSHAARHL